MHQHRFSHLFAETAVTVPASGGLTPCPAPLLASVSAERQAWMAELYRVALERAREQVGATAGRIPLSVYARSRTTIWN